MAYTLRNVEKSAHTPAKEKLLTGETNKGIGSVKKIVMAQKELARKLKAAQEAA